MGRRSRMKRAYAKALLNPNDRRRQIARLVEPGTELRPRWFQGGPSLGERLRRRIGVFFARIGGDT